MGTAASGRLDGDAGELEELVYHWGDAYNIAVTGGMFTAPRRDGRDGRGGSLADPSPEGLLRQIRADYAAIPVARSTP